MKYKLNLETTPLWGIILLFGSFFIFFGLFLTFGFLGPQPFIISKTELENIDRETWKKFIKGELSLDIIQEDLSSFNSEFYFFVEFFIKKEIETVGFEIPLKVNISLYGSNTRTGQDEILLTPPEGIIHDRRLSCYSEKCSYLLLNQEKKIIYSRYKTRLTMINLGEKYLEILENQLLAVVTYSNWSYSFYELCFRYFFIFITIFISLIYLIYTRMKQLFHEWHLEQRWILILLIFLIFFNNPFYIFQFISYTSLFPFLNISFKVTYICLLLLILLMNTHSIYVKNRSFLSFYFLKFLLIGSLWFILILGFTYTNFQRDPAFSFSEETRFYKLLIGFIISLLFLYFLLLFYYILRIIGLWNDLPLKFTSKFLYIWGITIFIIFSSIFTLLLLYLFNILTPSIAFLSFQFILNYYTWILCFLFLPSNIKETISNYELEKDHF